MKILVVASCTKSKKYSEPDQTYRTKAIDMYGGSFLPIKRSVETFQRFQGDSSLDLVIVSAGYGVLRQNDLILPYDKTFSGKSKDHLVKEYERLNIKNDFHKLLESSYDLIIIAVGTDYAGSLGLEDISTDTPVLLIVDKRVLQKDLRKIENLFSIEHTQELNKIVGCAGIYLKGILIERALDFIRDKGIATFLSNPKTIFEPTTFF